MLTRAQAQRTQALRDYYNTHLGEFGRDVLGFDRLDISGVHAPILHELESGSQFVLLLLPRGSYKSTIASVSYPLWKLAGNRNLRILIDSQTDHQSKKFLIGIKNQIEANDRFKEIYGDWKNVPGWAAGSIEIAGRDPRLRDPSVQVSGVNVPITGGHYEIIICDDLHDEKNSKTPEQCEKVIEHWKTLFPILQPGGQMIVIGTRWSPLDLYGYILKNQRCLQV